MDIGNLVMLTSQRNNLFLLDAILNLRLKKMVSKLTNEEILAIRKQNEAQESLVFTTNGDNAQDTVTQSMIPNSIYSRYLIDDHLIR